MTPISGTCRCGAVAIEISSPPVMTSACHCRGCQRMSASAFSLSVMVPSDGFRILRGEPVLGGLKGPGADHFFCPDCMTWMFSRFAAMADFVNARATMFGDAALSEPFLETMTAEKLAWASTPARRSYEGFPPAEDIAELLEEFAAAHR